MIKPFSLITLLAIVAHPLCANPLVEARVNKIINEVAVVDEAASSRPAQLNDVIKGNIGVKTGIKSRSELVFQDQTLTRLGPESYFSFKAGSRDMVLKEGTMLLQVPKGLGGAKIRTAAVTAAITGTTIMLEHRAGKHIKVLVLEGSMRLSINGTFGDSLLLLPGKMVIMRPDARRIPEPVSVDLARVVKTSSLVKMPGTGGTAEVAPLPSMQLIQHEIDLQAKAKDGSDLVDTNLVILGGGTNVLLAADDVLQAIDKKESIDALVVASNPNGGGDGAGGGSGSGTGNGGPAPTPAASPNPSAAPSATPAATVTPVASATPSASATPGPSPSITPAPTATPQPSSTPAPTATPQPTETPEPTASATPVLTPSPQPSATPEPSASPTPAATATPEPSATPTPVATATPEPTATPQPSATPTAAATATPTPVPTPTPDPNADPGPTGPNQPLTTAANSEPYQITASTVITTTRGSTTIATAPRVDSGTIYDSPANDGTFSLFLFGSTRPFDGSSGFEQLGSESAMPMALYKFVDIEIAGPATFNTSRGPKSVGIISEKNILDVGPGGNWDLSPLNALLLATQKGDITLGAATSFSGTSAQLVIYARDGGKLSMASPVTLTTGSVRLMSESDMTLSGAISAANIEATSGHHMTVTAPFSTAGAMKVNANGDVVFDVGSTVSANTFTATADKFELADNVTLTASTVNITTTSDVQAGGVNSVIDATNLTIAATGQFTLNTTLNTQTRQDLAGINLLDVSAKKITVLNSITMPAGSVGILRGGGEGIAAGGFDLQNFDTITANSGSVSVNHLDVRTLSTTAGNATVTGDLSVEQATVDGDLKVAGLTRARPGVPTTFLTARKFELTGGLQFAGKDAGLIFSSPTAGGHAVLNSTDSDIKFDTGAGAILSANFDGGSAASLLNFVGGGDGGTLEVGTDTTPAANKIIVNLPISATTGQNATLVAVGGKGGTVNAITNDEVQVNSTIKVSDSAVTRASAQGGNITLKSNKTSGTAIAVSSSAQLLSLLSNAAPGAGGTIKITSAGGDVNVSGTARADRGHVEIRNNGAGGVINLTNATLHGNTVKAQVLGADGQLNLGNSTISADAAISLYAAGSNGEVKFNENVTLSGSSVKTIQANTVTVRDGKVVTISGPAPANVFTNTPNYSGSGGNGSTTGTFGGQGATTAPLSAGPGPGG